MNDAEQVFQSYGRSCKTEDFFEDFYRNFLDKSPVIRDMFKNTDMSAQRALLRSGVLWLIMHARGMPDTKIRALGESHNRHHYNVHPEYYALWLDALIETLQWHDPAFSVELEMTWRRVLQPMIDRIAGMY